MPPSLRQATGLLCPLIVSRLLQKGMQPVLRLYSAQSSAECPRHAQLTSRGVILIEGQQALPFLQGMVTNDVRPLESTGEQAPVYAALLTAKGKVLHDVFFHKIAGASTALLMEVDRQSKDAALAWLTRYKLRQSVSLKDVSGDYKVWAAWGSSQQPSGHWHPDPRLPQMGFRVALPVSETPRPAGSEAASEEEYRSWRCQLGVPEGSQEIPSGQAAALEYNLDLLNGVSYTKGCYIGQERNSFTHYKGVIRRRLMPVILQPPSSDVTTSGVAPDAEVLDTASSKPVGHIRASAGQHGLAHLKLDVALKAAQGQAQLTAKDIEGSDVKVIPVRPEWWPSIIGHEEE